MQVHVKPDGMREDIYGWMIVMDPEGRDDIYQVFAQVFHPSDASPWLSSEKYKKSVSNPLDPNMDEDEILEALDATLLSQHLTKDECDDIVHMVFEKPHTYVYRIQLPMSYCEPTGLYKVCFWAVDSDCRSSEECIVYFEWNAKRCCIHSF